MEDKARVGRRRYVRSELSDFIVLLLDQLSSHLLFLLLEDDLFDDDEFCWDVEAEHHTTNSQGEGLCKWVSRYLDGSIGYFTYSDGDNVFVRWAVDGDAWFYDLEQLEILGEV